MGKVHCPKHEDSHPSVEVYPTHGFCFAGCGLIPLTMLGLEREQIPTERYREDLSAKRDYISTLPKDMFRGFSFPYDEVGFYICWPDSLYYKQRVFEPGDGPKYRNPSGHPQPPYKVREMRSPRLFLAEGELNAMSLGLTFPNSDVISPGSASEFMSKKAELFYTGLPIYDRIIIVTDRDASGTAAAISAKAHLLKKAANIDIVLVEEDANQVHNEKGIEALRESLETRLSQGMQRKDRE